MNPHFINIFIKCLHAFKCCFLLLLNVMFEMLYDPSNVSFIFHIKVPKNCCEFVLCLLLIGLEHNNSEKKISINHCLKMIRYNQSSHVLLILKLHTKRDLLPHQCSVLFWQLFHSCHIKCFIYLNKS